MGGFRNKRITLLVIFALISVALIVGKGPNWGIDITGGTRIMLQAESTQLRIKIAEQNTVQIDNHVNKILERLEDELNVQKPLILENYKQTKTLKVQIGKKVTENMISPYLPDGDKIVPGSLTYGTIERSRDRLIDALRERIDPFGTLGAQFKPVGERYIRFEVSLSPDKARTLLGETGRLEIFIENKLVIRGEHISVQSVSYNARDQEFGVPFNFRENGAKRFANATKGKAGTPGIIYLDRPTDSVLLFRESFLEDLVNSAELPQTTIDKADYLKDKHEFRLHIPPPRRYTKGENAVLWFPVKVKALMVKNGALTPKTENYLLKNASRIKSVIYLGELNELNENLVSGENLVFDNHALPIENISQGDRLPNKQLERATGIRSYPSISSEIAGDLQAARRGLSITIPGKGEETRNEAEQLKIVLSQSLPVSVSIQSITHLNPRLGNQALEEVFKAGIAAFIAVGLLIFFRYRRLKIVIPLMITMLCEVGITLGFSSIFPERLLTLGLPELGGLIAVIGTGVDHQIIIADELLGKKISETGKLPIDRRTKRAFSVIFAAAATTVAAMIALAYVGLGAMRGFAIITIVGVAISVLITRPAYARIVGTLLEREQAR